MQSRSRRGIIADLGPSSTSTQNISKSILEMSLTQARGEVNMDAYLVLFSELVSYCRDRVESVVALQDKLSQLGYRIGRRALELILVREKVSRRETRLLNMLNFIAVPLWNFLYGKQADSLKKVRDSEQECKFVLPSVCISIRENWYFNRGHETNIDSTFITIRLH